MATWEITTKEVGRERPIVTTWVGERGDDAKTREYLIDFFGLRCPDVESFKIKKL